MDSDFRVWNPPTFLTVLFDLRENNTFTLLLIVYRLEISNIPIFVRLHVLGMLSNSERYSACKIR